MKQNIRGEVRTEEGINLLEFRPVRAIILWRGFPYVFQAFFAAVLVGLILLGWGRAAPEGVDSKLFAKGNLVNLVLWGIWWPMMIWCAVLLGRVWCMVCPLELIAGLSERAGRRLGVPQRTLGKTIRGGVLILVFYAAVQLLVAGVNLHRVPGHTSHYLLALLLGAAVVGFLYKHRAFCSGFCPLAMLLGTYGRGGMIAVRGDAGLSCCVCIDKACKNPARRDRLDARACPSLLNPPHLKDNADCLVCGQCIKACEPRTMRLLLRPPFSPLDQRIPAASWPLTLFIMLLSGFVSYELSGGWEFTKHAFLATPARAGETLGLGASNGWVIGAWTLFVFPLLLWTVLGALMKSYGAKGSLGDCWRGLALPMAVVIAGAHMAKGLEKAGTWAGFLPGAMNDPLGVASVQAYLAGTIPLPGAPVPNWLIAYAGAGLILLASVYGIRESKIASQAEHRYRMPPLLLAAFILAACAVGWAY